MRSKDVARVWIESRASQLINPPKRQIVRAIIVQFLIMFVQTEKSFTFQMQGESETMGSDRVDPRLHRRTLASLLRLIVDNELIVS